MKGRLLMRAVFVGMILGLLVGYASAATVTEQPGPNGTTDLVMDNGLLRMVIAPSEGGRIVSFIDKAVGQDAISNRRTQGLLADHFQEQRWPGEFWDATYKVSIREKEGSRITVRLTARATGWWKKTGASYLKDVVVSKEITLRDRSRVVNVRYRLENPTRQGKRVNFWVQNVVSLGGKVSDNIYYRPSLRGVQAIRQSDYHSAGAKPFLRDSAVGWTAVADPTGQGLVFLMDYNYLDSLYNAFPAGTVEWFYNSVAIPPGKAWETEVKIISLPKVKNIVAACDKFVVGLKIKPDKARAVLTLYPLSSGPLPLKVAGNVFEVSRQVRHELPVENITLGREAKEVKFSLPSKLNDPWVLRENITIKGGKKARPPEHFEYYFGGTYGPNWTIQGTPIYKAKARPKEITILKPEKIALQPHSGKRALLVLGLFSEEMRLKEALKAAGFDHINSAYHFITLTQTTALQGFPADYNELLGYDLIVLSNVDTGALGEFGSEMVKDFVNVGGGLIVLGGFYSLAEGDYYQSRLKEVLPLKETSRPDMLFGFRDSRLKLGKNHVLSGSLDWSTPIHCYYMNKLLPRYRSAVVMTVDGHPAVVVGTFGKGRVAVVGLTPMGKVPEGSIPFWKSSQWTAFLAKLAGWAIQRGQ